MAAITRLSVDGYGARRAGSFAGKVGTVAVVEEPAQTGGGSYRPYRYIPLSDYGQRKKRRYQNEYDEEELKRLVVETEELQRNEIQELERKTERLFIQGKSLSEIRESVRKAKKQLEDRINAQILFDIDLELRVLEIERKKKMALLLLMSAV